MHAIHKVFDNSCKHDLADKLHGRVMVFTGRLSDNSPAIAKLPAIGALFDQEVGTILTFEVQCGKRLYHKWEARRCDELIQQLQRCARSSHKAFLCGLLAALILMLQYISELEQAKVDTWWVQAHNLKLVGSWPELLGSVVHLRGIGHTRSFPRHLLILQPVGCLVPYNIGLEALLTIMKQFASVVKQLSAKGYLHGDFSYYNLLKHQDTDAALLVDMQTLMPLQEVLILGSNLPCCK